MMMYLTNVNSDDEQDQYINENKGTDNKNDDNDNKENFHN